jgi:hypothetical protein
MVKNFAAQFRNYSVAYLQFQSPVQILRQVIKGGMNNAGKTTND